MQNFRTCPSRRKVTLGERRKKKEKQKKPLIENTKFCLQCLREAPAVRSDKLNLVFYAVSMQNVGV
jgi:hypothetical protein